MTDIEQQEENNWLQKCLKCEYCYTLKEDELEYHCRKGKCDFKEYKFKKKRKQFLKSAGKN